MGEVYRARDVRLSRDVALKVVHADLAPDRPSGSAASSTRPRPPARSTTPTSSPSTTPATSEGSPYIVSELLEGETLRDRLATAPSGLRKAVEYAVQIVRGLAAAHERGHRAPRPEAREPVPDQGRAREDPRLRDREARSAGRGESRNRRRRRCPIARARARCWARSATCLRSRCAASRPTTARTSSPSGRCSSRCSPAAGVQGHDAGRHAERDPARGPDRGRPAAHLASAGSSPRRAAMSREDARGSLPDCARSGLRPRRRRDWRRVRCNAGRPSGARRVADSRRSLLGLAPRSWRWPGSRLWLGRVPSTPRGLRRRSSG